MARAKMDTRAIGLDVGISFAKWLTGAENLHYGDWTGLEVNAANFGPEQVAYTDRLFRFLPDKPCRILDIGGGGRDGPQAPGAWPQGRDRDPERLPRRPLPRECQGRGGA
jgi:hypothetical protein